MSTPNGSTRGSTGPARQSPPGCGAGRDVEMRCDHLRHAESVIADIPAHTDADLLDAARKILRADNADREVRRRAMRLMKTLKSGDEIA